MQPKQPEMIKITFLSRNKPRVSSISDRSIGALMKAALKRIDAKPRAFPGSERLEGIFFLQGNNILEVYKTPDGKLSGFLFCTIDAWLNYDANPDPSTFF